jgi:hypothetical protein
MIKTNEGQETYADDDGALELLIKAGAKHAAYHSDHLPDLAESGVIGNRDCIGAEFEPEKVFVKVPGRKFTPKIRRVAVMGPHPHPKDSGKEGWFWYVTSNLEGILTRKGKPDDTYSPKNIFASGPTRISALRLWISNYTNRRYNEK